MIYCDNDKRHESILYCFYSFYSLTKYFETGNICSFKKTENFNKRNLKSLNTDYLKLASFGLIYTCCHDIDIHTF